MITKFCCFPSKILSSLSLFLHATAIARPVIPWLNLYNILPNDVPDCCIVSFSFSTFSKTQMWLCLVAQSCPSLCNPIGCSPSGSSVRGDSPVKNTGLGCHVLLQGIFPTQGSNPGLSHCRWILYGWATREAYGKNQHGTNSWNHKTSWVRDALEIVWGPFIDKDTDSKK